MYGGRKWKTDPATGKTLINYNQSTSGTKSSTGMPEYETNKDIGQVLPKWTGGMFNAMRYKNFDLTFSIDYQSGGLFYSETRNFNTGAGLSEETVGVNDEGNDWRDYPGTWTFDGGNTGKGGILIPGVFNDGKGTPNNRYITARGFWYTARQMDASNVLLDASYIKLREVRFGYSLPTRIIQKLGVAKSVNFGIIVQNAWLIWANSKKYGVDPSELEVFYREGGQLSATRQIGANLRGSFNHFRKNFNVFEMKKIIGIISVSLLVAGCNKFGDTNVRSNSIAKCQRRICMTNSLQAFPDLTMGNIAGSRLAALYVQHLAEGPYPGPSLYNDRNQTFTAWYAGSGAVTPPSNLNGPLYNLQTIINYNNEGNVSATPSLNGAKDNSDCSGQDPESLLFPF